MQVTYQSAGFNPATIVSVYISYNAYGTVLKQYDVNAVGYTIRESVVQPEDHKPEHVAKALANVGKAFNQVKVS